MLTGAIGGDTVERRPTIMTVEEVARYLRVHAMTVYRMIQRGDLPALRVGRGWRFKKDQIEKWLLDHETNSNHFTQRTTPQRATPQRTAPHRRAPRGRGHKRR